MLHAGRPKGIRFAIAPPNPFNVFPREDDVQVSEYAVTCVIVGNAVKKSRIDGPLVAGNDREVKKDNGKGKEEDDGEEGEGEGEEGEDRKSVV